MTFGSDKKLSVILCLQTSIKCQGRVKVTRYLTNPLNDKSPVGNRDGRMPQRRKGRLVCRMGKPN